MKKYDMELIERAKSILMSDSSSEEEIIYTGYLLNNYLDNPSIKNKIHLNDVCFFIESKNDFVKKR